MKTVRRIALALFAILVAMCAAPLPAYAQAAPPVRFVSFTPDAIHTLDSLARDARTTRTENAACLAGYAISHDSLTLVRFTPASYAKADSVAIYVFGNQPICPIGVPSIHSHVAFEGFPQPSDQDLYTQARLGMWSMVLSVTDSAWRIIVY